MKAVVLERFGGPDELRVAELPDPEPTPGKVRVAVHAAGTNPVDASSRADGSWAGLLPPCVLGYDVAGVVDAIGAGVAGVEFGDRVMAMTPFPSGAGGYAELVIVDADHIAPVPDDCSLIDAAAVPLAGGTAQEVLRRLDLPAGSWALVLGASGGVGTFLVQLAAADGIRVAAVGSGRSHGLLADLGASVCIDYRAGPIAAAAVEAIGRPVDVIVDLVGGDVLRACLPAVRSHGQLAAIATPELDLDPLLDENLTFHGILIETDGERLRLLSERLAAHEFRSIVAEVFPPERAPDAHRLLETEHAGGKVVLGFRQE